MIFDTFEEVRQTNIDMSEINFGDQYCGLFRCPLEQAAGLMPAFTELFESAPVDNPKDWEIDLKVHMLMANQFPCLPNWHCDNVPRYDGITNYSKIKEDNPKMLLWVSGMPCTEFLKKATEMPTPLSHADLAETIMSKGYDTVRIAGQTWVAMSQKTPHRGCKAEEPTWRVFARLTHNSIAPVRPKGQYIRRHCQVYLDPTSFSW